MAELHAADHPPIEGFFDDDYMTRETVALLVGQSHVPATSPKFFTTPLISMQQSEYRAVAAVTKNSGAGSATGSAVGCWPRNPP